MRATIAVLTMRVIMTLAMLFMPLSLLHGASMGAQYRGFTIDESRVRNLANLDGVIAATKEQIDIVCGVGAPTEDMEFFRSVPFILVPADAIPRGTPGLYGRMDRTVKVTSRIVTTGHKPVLLHELLHAYHDQKLPQGFRNRKIIGLFEQAKTIAAFERKSHMMENEKEYFACSATTYLFGVTAQEPFRRDKVMKSQPELFAYLKALFGPNAGNFEGSLTR